MKTIVVGAGIVGTATAYFLCKLGHEVDLLDRQPGAALETSFGNGGVIHASEVEPWSQPGMPAKIVKWLGREDAPLLLRYGAIPRMWRWGLAFAANCTSERFRRNMLNNLRLAAHSLQILQSLREARVFDYDLGPTGLLKVYASGASYDKAARSAERLGEHGLDFEALDRAACVALEPALSETAHNLAGGLYFPREEVGDCHKFTTSLAHQAAADGARLRFGTDVVALESSGGRITSVRTRDGRIDADNVVLACASFTPRLVRPLGIRVPIYPVKGVTITVSGAAWAGRVRLPVVDDSRFFGLVPLGDRLRVSGSAEIADFDTAPSEARCGAILRNVVSVFPGLARCLEKGPPQYWAGLRPVTPTGTPIIDRTPISNLFVNAGHGHLGWTMGCGSGHVMASLVTGESPAIDMSGFRLAEH